jgi:cystathionine beta-lyase
LKQFDKKKNRKNSNSQKWDRYQSQDILPMWVADMDFESPACIKSALRKYVDNGIFGYHSEPKELRDILKKYLKNKGWNIKKEWIVLTPSVGAPIYSIYNLIPKNKQVIIPTPIYLNFLKAPKHHRRKVQKLPMVEVKGRLVIDFNKLSSTAKKNSWLMFVNPQNPGGTVYSKKEIKNLSKIVKEKNITVFSDELHCDLILQKNLKHIPLGSMKTIEKNVVSFYSASKTFNVPGLSCAFAVIPCDDLRKAFKKNAEGIIDDANITGLIALTTAFKKGWKWRDDLITYLNKNLETLLNSIKNHKNASPVVPQATYLLWVSLKNPKRKNLQSHFEKYGVGINDGIEFGKKNNIRINFATNHQNIKKASKRIEEALINL